MEFTESLISGIADQTDHRTTNIASAEKQNSASVLTAASATEVLLTSIHVIWPQLSQSFQISSYAVDQASNADKQIQGLAQAANKIGEVVALITDIVKNPTASVRYRLC